MGWYRPGPLTGAKRLLQKHGYNAASQPTRSPNYASTKKWHRPILSSLQLSRLRRRAILDGTFGEYDPSTGEGWDLRWEKKCKPMLYASREPKGHKRHRNLMERVRKVDQAMENMPEIVKAYRQKVKEKKDPPLWEKLTDIDFFKKNT